MSVNSSVREQVTDSERIQKMLLEQEALFIQGLKPLSSESAGGLDAQGGAAADSGNQTSPQGNFLATLGDTMIGPIAFFPRLVTIDTDSIDVSKEGGNFTGKIFIIPQSGTTDNLSTIFGAEHNGQKLTIQCLPNNTITIDALDNIIPPDGVSFDLVGRSATGRSVELQFDAASNKWRFESDAIWQDLVDQIVAGGGGDPATWSQFPATQNVDFASKSIFGLNDITFDTSALIASDPVGLIYNVLLSDEHLFLVGGFIKGRFDALGLDMEEDIRMNNKEIRELNNIQFNDPSRFIQNDDVLSGIDYIVDGGESHFFFDDSLSFMNIGSTIDIFRPVDMNSGVIAGLASLNFSNGSVWNTALFLAVQNGFGFFGSGGKVFEFRDEFGSQTLKMDSSARIDFNNSTFTAIGGSATLPSQPGGFISVRIGGTNVKIPFYF